MSEFDRYCDCAICGGEGLVGSDGKACACVRAGCRYRHRCNDYGVGSHPWQPGTVPSTVTPVEPAGDLYLQLFHGRTDPDAAMLDWGLNGPAVGPFRFFHVTYNQSIKVGNEHSSEICFPFVGDLVYYSGVYYGDYSVCRRQDVQTSLHALEAFDPAKAVPPPRQPEAFTPVLARRLLQANQLGIRVYQEDGHRWLQWLVYEGNDAYDLVDWCRLEPDGLPTKEYGSVSAALDQVDQVLARHNLPSLLEQFHAAWGGEPEVAWGFKQET